MNRRVPVQVRYEPAPWHFTPTQIAEYNQSDIRERNQTQKQKNDDDVDTLRQLCRLALGIGLFCISILMVGIWIGWALGVLPRWF